MADADGRCGVRPAGTWGTPAPAATVEAAWFRAYRVSLDPPRITSLRGVVCGQVERPYYTRGRRSCAAVGRDEFGLRLRVTGPVVAEPQSKFALEHLVLRGQLRVRPEPVTEGELCSQLLAVRRRHV